MANPNLGQIIATTLFMQRDETADLVTYAQPVLIALKERGKIKRYPGGYELRYGAEFTQPSGQWYSGAQQLSTYSPDIYDVFQFPWRQVAAPCVITGYERRINSGSKFQLKNLVKGKVDNSKKALRNSVSVSSMSDGTGSGGLEILGLDGHMGATQTSGTIGGIERGSYTWARCNTLGFTADLTLTWSATTIQQGLLAAHIKCIRNNSRPDLALATATPWQFLHNSMTALQIQTKVGSDIAKAGFATVYFMGAEYVLMAGYGITEGTAVIYLMTLGDSGDGWEFAVHQDLDFGPLGDQRTPVDQDLTVEYVGAMCQLCTNNYPFNCRVVA
jgi:hypothetical protein